MLSPDDLREALHGGLKAADKCSNAFCRAGASIEEGNYLIHHNGTGATTTDRQVVTAAPVLSLGKEQLAVKVQSWIEGLHKGERVDLNAMEIRGPAMAGWPWIVPDSHHFQTRIGDEIARVCRLTCVADHRADHFSHVRNGA